MNMTIAASSLHIALVAADAHPFRAVGRLGAFVGVAVAIAFLIYRVATKPSRPMHPPASAWPPVGGALQFPYGAVPPRFDAPDAVLGQAWHGPTPPTYRGPAEQQWSAQEPMPPDSVRRQAYGQPPVWLGVYTPHSSYFPYPDGTRHGAAVPNTATDGTGRR